MKMKKHDAKAVTVRVEKGEIVVYAPGEDPVYVGSECSLYELLYWVTA